MLGRRRQQRRRLQRELAWDNKSARKGRAAKPPSKGRSSRRRHWQNPGPDDSQGSEGLDCGNVVTATNIEQRCVDDLRTFPNGGAPEELAKIIIKAVNELTTIEGISKAKRFKREISMRAR